MGKKMSKTNVKKSKRNSSCSNSTSHAKQNLNHLVKVLKPRVYITHPSNFKFLVQDLTGNGIITIPSSVPFSSSQSSVSSIISQPTDDQHFQLTQDNIIVDQDCCYGFQESSQEWSFERSCSEIINVPTMFDAWNISEVLDMSTQILSNDMIDQFHSSLFGGHEDTSLLRYGDEVEYSWISERNNPFGYNHDAPIMPLEVCEYACDLSGLL